VEEGIVAEHATTESRLETGVEAGELLAQDGLVELDGVARPYGRFAGEGNGRPETSPPVHTAWWTAGGYRRVGTKPRVASVRVWTILLMTVDATMALLAAVTGSVVRFGDATTTPLLHGVPYLALGAALPVLWVGAMLIGRSYDRRYLAAGAEQFRRVANSAVWVLGLVAFVSFILRADFSRGLVAIAIPVATVFTLLGRWGTRAALRRRFDHGVAIHRVVAVGGRVESEQLAAYVTRNRHTGYAVVGTFAADPESGDLPLDIDRLVEDVRCVGADTIAFVETGHFRNRELRRLSWALQGSGINLLVVPDLADIAGPRIEVNPVDGLPLLEICEPELSGLGRLMKSLFDRTASFVLIIALSPFLLAIALSIRLNDGGPVIYRQCRIGRNGRSFRIWKFRTMAVDAAPRYGSVESSSGSMRVLQKERDDDRVTRVGHFLRRYSLDELPQLFNVLTGTMSLVGPRPLVPDEVDSFEHGSQIRLLVAPGMTGLWQVSGRSELPWAERIHLDLYYIENWSMWLDFSLLWRTLRVMVHSTGAY
jgi:exopolysaccharide biosynthesis polyprenyl glycosylphosphotransferase